MKQGHTKTNQLQRVRCAIYTRKSTEENLNIEFNSLDAQREAGEAYIASQRGEGWIALPVRYDDAGFSGGTLERPALQRLLNDIEASQIDCVVVYKIDRLSRSLLDFTKLVEIFERQHVTFVSVTQQFNTTTSMGRLTLNILLSFAQFEREIIGERIRDKIAASKRKGLFCGGVPPLGYDLAKEARRLVVNPQEAELVRFIFTRFVQTGSVLKLVRELNVKGHRTKSWTAKNGNYRVGRPWDKPAAYRVLNNCLYVGEIEHKGEHFTGEHEALVSRDVWNKVQAIIEQNHRQRYLPNRTKTYALLRGILRCGHCGGSMGPTFTTKHGKVYRYYICYKATKNGAGSCPIYTLPAAEIEQAVINELRMVFRSPEVLATTFRATEDEIAAQLKALGTERAKVAKQSKEDGREAALAQLDEEIKRLKKLVVTEKDVREALNALDPIWEELFPEEQARLVRLLVDKVEVHPDAAEVHIRSEGLRSLAEEMQAEEVLV